jgi:uncharacterized membrane protein
MSLDPPPPPSPEEGRAFWNRWRQNFLTGLVLVAPAYLTVWLIWSSISFVDAKVARLFPVTVDVPFFYIPGYGLVFFVVVTALVGWVAKNIIAARVIAWSERMLDRLPIVRTVYNGIKQIAETMLTQSKTSFTKACLIEYPRRGIWAIGFISTEAQGEIAARVPDENVLSVFLPTTPNPTSGFLLYVRASDVIVLDMSVEAAAKLIISAGLVGPEWTGPEGKAEPILPGLALHERRAAAS